MGLGLAVAYGIVLQFGVFITYDSCMNEGTMIRILFPRTTNSDLEQKVPEIAGVPHAGSEMNLVVEDNDDMRELRRASSCPPAIRCSLAKTVMRRSECS